MYDVECPYCGYMFDLDTADGFFCTEDAYEVEECPECEKKMMISTNYVTIRKTFNADCLNDENGKHDWSKYIQCEMVDGKYTETKKRRCNACGVFEDLKTKGLNQ